MVELCLKYYFPSFQLEHKQQMHFRVGTTGVFLIKYQL